MSRKQNRNQQSRRQLPPSRCKACAVVLTASATIRRQHCRSCWRVHKVLNEAVTPPTRRGHLHTETRPHGLDAEFNGAVTP